MNCIGLTILKLLKNDGPLNIIKHRLKDLISFVWILFLASLFNWSILWIALLLFTCFIISHQEIWDWVLRYAGQDWCPPLQWKQHWARHSLWQILQGVHTGNHWPRWVSAFNQTLYNNIYVYFQTSPSVRKLELSLFNERGLLDNVTFVLSCWN